MFDDIEEFISNTITGLEDVIRWLPYTKIGVSKENDLQHSFSTVLLTILILEILDKTPPNINYDKYKILACSALHDLGEINVGDTLYKNKSSDSVNKELESYKQQINFLPDQLKFRLLDLYSVQLIQPNEIDSNSADFGNAVIFDFIERTGYLLFAMGEYKKSTENIVLLVQVIRNQLESIKELLNILTACRIIFPESLISWMEQVMIENEGKFIEK
jgi:5'-deoxynucleotidase YfbR-like HD superfamily hydrolase